MAFVSGICAEPCQSNNAGSGPITDVLRVNGSIGDSNRVVTSPRSTSISVSLNAAPMGPGGPGDSIASYVLWVWSGPPSRSFDLNVGTSSLGCVVNPTPFQPFASPQAFRCLRAGLPRQFCGSVSELHSPSGAPWTVTKGLGFSRNATFTLQAVLQDAGSSSSDHYSVTNAVVLRVQ